MLINSPNISGSLTVTGNAVITGSLTVAGGINATITGSATSASYVEYSNVANKPALVSGSSQVTYSGLTGVPSGIVSGSSQITYSGISSIPSGIVSSSAQVEGYNVFATTGSNQFNGSQAVTGSLTVTGQVVAQTLNVQQVTSSIVYSSGSNIFGNSLGNTQQFTGSVSVTGSLTTSIAAFGSAATTFLISDSGTIKSRTAAQTLSDIAALPLAGGTLTGALSGSSGGFSGNLTFAEFKSDTNVFKSNKPNEQGAFIRAAVSIASNPTFAFEDDQDTGMYRVTTNSLGFTTGGTNALTLASTGAATFASSGSFGGGTLNGANFIIKGQNGVPATSGIITTAVFRVSSGTGLYNVLDFGTNESLDYSWIQSTRANSLGTYDKLLIQPNGGHVLIGQTVASGATNGIYFRPGIESGFIVTSDVALQLSRLGTTGDIQTFYSGSTRVGKIAVGSSTVTFESNANGGITINSSGNVGIGTSSPSYKLDITNSVAASTSLDPITLRLYNGSDGGSAIYFQNSVSGQSKISFGVESTGAGTDDSYLGFSTGANTALSERMRITSAGRVGVGTDNPTTQLQIRNNYWQFWNAKSHDSNVNLFSITLPHYGAAIVTIAGSRYSPGADNYQGTSTFYIFVTNTNTISVNGGSNFGTWTPTTSVSSRTVTFSSTYAGSSTNYTNASIVIQGSGHNNGSESALTVAIL